MKTTEENFDTLIEALKDHIRSNIQNAKPPRENMNDIINEFERFGISRMGIEKIISNTERMVLSN